MESVSPWLRKVLAGVILLVAVWAAGAVGMRAVRARLAVRFEVEQLRQAHQELLARRVDLGSLETQATSLAKAGVQPSHISAENDRAAIAQLQQSVLKKIRDAGGASLSLDAIPAAAGAPTVAIQLRMRMSEKAIPGFLATIEADGWARFEDISASARNQAGQPNEIEISATLRAPWMREAKRTP